MHRHEDLIAALAEGSLDQERIPEVEALVLSDPEAAALLAAHRRALRAIGDTSPAMMAADERARVRTAVASALGIGDPADAVVPSRRARWTSLAAAAGALAAFLAFVPLAGMLTDGGVGRTTFDVAALRLAERSGDAGSPALDTIDPVLSFGGDRAEDGDLGPVSDQVPSGTVVIEPPPAEAETSTTTSATPTTKPDIDEIDPALEVDLDAVLGMLEEEIDGLDELLEAAGAIEPEGECASEAGVILDEHRPASTAEQELLGVTVTARDGALLLVFLERDPEGRVWNLVVLDPEGCLPVTPQP